MNYRFAYPVAATAILLASLPCGAEGQNRLTDLKVPAPAKIEVPAGNVPYLKANAAGTQNYVCLPGAQGAAWKFQGPQATLFVKYPWMQGEAVWQVATHYLRANPSENGTPRPAWQSSFDTSAVWGTAVAESTDPQYVAAGAIPWLLLKVAGAQKGPSGGVALSQTTYIQRVNTAGGAAPVDGCTEADYGKLAMAPYTTDYIFYQAEQGK